MCLVVAVAFDSRFHLGAFFFLSERQGKVLVRQSSHWQVHLEQIAHLSSVRRLFLQRLFHYIIDLIFLFKCIKFQLTKMTAVFDVTSGGMNKASGFRVPVGGRLLAS